MDYKYYCINKPYNMVSQFVSPDKVRLLGKLDFEFPEGTHAIGRLDNKSEGLLLLTTNKKITQLLFQSKVPHSRTYLVMVKHEMNAQSLLQLQTGTPIIIEGGAEYITPPCRVEIVERPAWIYDDGFVLRHKIPHTWLEITLNEGKFHQVRKMVASVRHPCQRLIRTSIEDLYLGSLQPGEVKEMDEDDFFEKLKLQRDI